MPSVLDVAKRALVKVLKKLAVKYGVKLKLTRDSTQKDVNAAFKKVSLRAHPDKGGEKTDFQNLSNANDSWQEALQNKGTPGRPSTEVGVPRPTTAVGSVSASLEEKKKFRVHSQAVLLTYQGFPAELNSFLQRPKLKISISQTSWTGAVYGDNVFRRSSTCHCRCHEADPKKNSIVKLAEAWVAWVFPKSSHQQSLKNSVPHRTWHAAFARDKKSSAQTSIDAPLKKFGTARRAAQNPGLVRGWNFGH